MLLMRDRDIVDVLLVRLCYGSAGTYNIMQPEMATALRERKLRNIESGPLAAIAGVNIGRLTQIASGTGIPVMHTVELPDWAVCRPRAAALELS